MKRQTIQSLAIALFIGFLIWGIYSLLVYLGVPVHGAALLNDTGQQAVTSACPTNSFVCRGVNAFFPTIIRTIGRGGTFLWYFVVSITLYALFAGYKGLQTGSFQIRMTMKPWHVLLSFVASTWLIFTVISQGEVDGVSIRRFVEPTPQVYGNIGEESLRQLQENYQDLNDRGCLAPAGTFSNGAQYFMLSSGCMQQSYFTRVLPPMIFVLLLLFELLIVGRFALSQLRVRTEGLLLETLFSACLGACAWVLLLWLIAVVGILTPVVGWVAMAVLPLVLYKHALYWLHTFWSETWEVDRSWNDVGILIIWLLLSYIALNFLFVVRPFPIGWDDLGSYLNRPRLMVSYGNAIYSMATFQWEYLTSLGFLLFGYDEPLGATASMQINWMAGLLAIFAIFTFARTFIGERAGYLSGLLYYSLPLVGHFSFADMKIDNAVFTMGAVSIFAAFQFLFPRIEEERISPSDDRWTPAWSWLITAGVLCAFGFAMKATTVMVIMMIGAVLLGALLHWSAFVGAIFMAFFVFVEQGALYLPHLGRRLFGESANLDQTTFALTLFVIGFVAIGYGIFTNRKKIKITSKSVGIFLASILVCVAPWFIRNNILVGNAIPRVELGAPNNITPILDIDGSRRNSGIENVRSLPQDLVVDLSDPLCTPTGNKEELDRYWGFRTGWSHYLTLPWRSVMNIDSGGYYVTTIPALLLFPLLLLLPFFWKKSSSWLRWLFLGTLFLVGQWMFLANGIPWYGIGMFLGLIVVLETFVQRAPDTLNRVAVSILIAMSLVITFGMRFWQFETQRNLLEYPLGKVSAAALRERTIPHYNDITDVVVQRSVAIPNRPYLYRIGTFIPYFIPRNLEIIAAADHQLDLFNCLYSERDAQLTLQRLKALGFNSIIFDTNTATIERDVNGTLHQKVNTFVDFVNNPELNLQIGINDPSAGVAFILIP